MQDRPSSCSSPSSWPRPTPVSPLRSLADMQSGHLASSDCIEEMSYSGVEVREGGVGDEDSSRDISRSQVSKMQFLPHNLLLFLPLVLLLHLHITTA